MSFAPVHNVVWLRLRRVLLGDISWYDENISVLTPLVNCIPQHSFNRDHTPAFAFRRKKGRLPYFDIAPAFRIREEPVPLSHVRFITPHAHAEFQQQDFKGFRMRLSPVRRLPPWSMINRNV